MKFLVDVGVSKKVEKWLLQNGYDVKSVRDINPKAKAFFPLFLICHLLIKRILDKPASADKPG